MAEANLLQERPATAAISQAEWDVRVRLAAAYRLIDHFGWTEQIHGHLTARVPGPDDYFLINPWGLNFAADLDSYQAMQSEPEGEIEFAALMRKLDRIDDGYRC